MRKVLSVRPLPDFELELRFDTDEVKVFDTKPYLERGVFGELNDPEYFSRVKMFLDSIAWPHGQDFDPDHLYEEGRDKSLQRAAGRGGQSR
jgi:hypothetical protein